MSKAKIVTCVKKCFLDGRIYMPGETLALGAKDKVPAHFKEGGKKESTDLKEEAKNAVEAVGHKPDGKNAAGDFLD